MVERALLRLLFPEAVLSTQPVETSYKKKMRKQKGSAARTKLEAEWIPQPARVFVHEVLTDHTLSIYWSDPQTGHYAEQIWRAGLARVGGFCVLSGRVIVQGDQVFRPRRSVMCVPANWDRMILASVVEVGHPCEPRSDA